MSALLAEEFHEITHAAEDASSDKNKNDVRHSVPYDKSHVHIWIKEPATASGVLGAPLTQDGITQIAFHKYHAGQNTILDGLLNPTWAALTECLPMNMAPNLVTLLGGAHCLVAYLLTWYYTLDFNAVSVPCCWVLIVNAYAQCAYYTLDCMDGKQARRTKSSSPVGQLFDHGMDCLCLLAHLSSVHAYLGCGSDTGGGAWFFATQAWLQVSFFLAQWEEYYTGVLPHCCGQIGVTETNYGLAVSSLMHGIVLHLQTSDESSSFYSQPLMPLMFPNTSSSSSTTLIKTLRAIVTRFCNVILNVSTDELYQVQVKQGVVIAWVGLLLGLIVLCLHRVQYYCINKDKKCPGVKLYLSALSKLVTPLVVSACPFFVPTQIYQDRPGTLRVVHLSVGLCMALLTIKLIVFAMSRQAYATLQGDGIPLLFVIIWINNDARITNDGVHLLFMLLTAWYLYRIGSWTNAALTQLCERLQIHLFTISPPPMPTAGTKKESSKDKMVHI